MLKSKVLYEHVDVSGIMLINNSSRSSVQPPVLRLDALRRSMTDDLHFDGHLSFSSRTPVFFFGQVSAKSSPCVKPDTRSSL